MPSKFIKFDNQTKRSQCHKICKNTNFLDYTATLPENWPQFLITYDQRPTFWILTKGQRFVRNCHMYVRQSLFVIFLRTKLVLNLRNFYCRFGTYYPYLGIKVRWYTENASSEDRGRPTSKQFLAHFHRRTNLEPCLRKWIDPSSYAKTDFESWCVTLKDDQFFIF